MATPICRNLRNSVYAPSEMVVAAMSIADELQAVRKRRGLSVRTMAAIAGVSATTMDRYLKGTQPDPKYCDGVGKLIGRTGEEVRRMAGHAPAAEPPHEELPAWLRSMLPVLSQLDAVEGEVLEDTAASLLKLREHRSRYGDTQE